MVVPVGRIRSNPERYVHNLSSLCLDKTLIEVLSLGPKFCCPSSNVTQLNLEVQFENLFDQLSGLVPSSELNVEQLKTTLVNSCYQYLNYKAGFSQFITKEHKEALRNLRNNKQIPISRSDKGSGIVLIDKKDYVDKMDNI